MTEKQPGKDFHGQLVDKNTSALQKYRDLMLGENSTSSLVRYELTTLFLTSLPGAIGLGLRKIFFPGLLARTGGNVIFGRNVSIRHGSKIEIGNNVIIDDNVLLDAKGTGNRGIRIGDNCIVSRNSVISCKGGDVDIGDNCTLGINSLIHAIEGSNVSIGNDVVIGAYSYFIGGGTYVSDELDVPFKQQGAISKGGVKVKDNVWIGSQVQILDGVTIGTGCVIGSGAVVTRSLTDYSVSAGVPAKIIKMRR
jgi:acetyltransferase-like isoleucine patch superfamily enzyme